MRQVRRRPHNVAEYVKAALSAETLYGESMKIAQIQIGFRYRKDLRDLRSLADSMGEVGLLHPVVVTLEVRLIAGQRRLEACRLLGWTKIPVTVVDLLQTARARRMRISFGRICYLARSSLWNGSSNRSSVATARRPVGLRLERDSGGTMMGWAERRPMELHPIGIDLGKTLFHLVGMDANPTWIWSIFIYSPSSFPSLAIAAPWLIKSKRRDRQQFLDDAFRNTAALPRHRFRHRFVLSPLPHASFQLLSVHKSDILFWLKLAKRHRGNHPISWSAYWWRAKAEILSEVLRRKDAN
jgi:hypothetical protein